MISYEGIRVLLAKKGLKFKYLREELKINPNTIASINKDEYVSMDTLVRIATHFDVDIGDLVEIKKDPGI